VSSFSRRPRTVLPSRVTMRTGRLIGHIALDGSSSARCSAGAVRLAPMSLKSGAVRGPTPLTR